MPNTLIDYDDPVQILTARFYNKLRMSKMARFSNGKKATPHTSAHASTEEDQPRPLTDNANPKTPDLPVTLTYRGPLGITMDKAHIAATHFKKIAFASMRENSDMCVTQLKSPILAITGELARQPVTFSERFDRYQLWIAVDPAIAPLLTSLMDKVMDAPTDLPDEDRSDWTVNSPIKDEEDRTIAVSLKTSGKGANQKFTLRSNFKLTVANHIELLYPGMRVHMAASIGAWYRPEDMTAGIFLTVEGIKFDA